MILDHWREMSGKFVKVMPIDYRKALERLREREAVKSEDAATEEVFRERRPSRSDGSTDPSDRSA